VLSFSVHATFSNFFPERAGAGVQEPAYSATGLPGARRLNNARSHADGQYPGRLVAALTARRVPNEWQRTRGRHRRIGRWRGLGLPGGHAVAFVGAGGRPRSPGLRPGWLPRRGRLKPRKTPKRPPKDLCLRLSGGGLADLIWPLYSRSGMSCKVASASSSAWFPRAQSMSCFLVAG